MLLVLRGLIINVGIFWFYKNKLIAKKIDIKELETDEIGIVDSPFQHITEWESKNIYLPSYKELIASEYQEFPRGRVVYATLSKTFICYMDNSLFTASHKQQLIKFFGLLDCNIVWKKDAHYKIYSY